MKTLSNPGDVARLLGRLHKVRPEATRVWGKMSAHQMICHLNDSFLVGLGERRVSSEVDFVKRTLVKWIALYAPTPWPHGVPTRPEVDQEGGGGTKPTQFERDAEELESVVDRFRRTEHFEAHHPIFGRLTTAEWQRWGYLHFDHHLRQFGV